MSSPHRIYVEPPNQCPACDTTLILQGEYLLCRGDDCPAQVLGGIRRWVEKIGLLGIGDSIIEALIEHAGVTDAADLYTLDPKKIENIPTGSDGSRLGRTATIIVEELRSKSDVPLFVFVGSLGIPLCARSVCRMIVDAGYDSLDKMGAATKNQIAAIPGIGAIKADEFVRGFRAKRELMDKLLRCGVTIKIKAEGSLSGKSACMTGFRSPEMAKAIEDAGGTVKDSVGKGLTYLVCKDKTTGSGKMQKALSLGVIVLDVAEMWALLGRGTSSSSVTHVTTHAQRKPSPEAASSTLDLFGCDD